MILTAELFARAGRAMFGDEWQNPMAALIGMNPRTVRRISAAARDGLPYDMNQTLCPLLAEHLRISAVAAKDRAKEAQVVARLLE